MNEAIEDLRESNHHSKEVLKVARSTLESNDRMLKDLEAELKERHPK